MNTYIVSVPTNHDTIGTVRVTAGGFDISPSGMLTFYENGVRAHAFRDWLHVKKVVEER